MRLSNMTQIFLPFVSENSGVEKPVPFGFAIYGVPIEVQHRLMKGGYRIQHWYATESCFRYKLYMPMLRGKDYVVPLEQVKEFAEKYPGFTWGLWNEPDRPTQDRTSPADALAQTREWIDTIGVNGRIAGYGVGLEPNYFGWRNWLDEFLYIGGPVPDCWQIHIYANDVVEWNNLYEEWQQWNSINGNLPTIISEAGGLPYEDGNFDGWKSIYYHLRRWIDKRVEGVYLYTKRPEWFVGEF